MKSIENEIKKTSQDRLNETLPPVMDLDKAPLHKKFRLLPVMLTSLGVTVIALAIVLPITLSKNATNYNYVEKEDVIEHLTGQLQSNSNSDIMPSPSFNRALRSSPMNQMAIVEHDFDASKSSQKYAITISKTGADTLSEFYIGKGEKWRTIEKEIINMYGGCEIFYDIRNDLKCVSFAVDEKIPAVIDNRYVIAIYYEGENHVVEELTTGLTNGDKTIDYYSATGIEGDDGFLIENVPEPFSNQIFYTGSKIINESNYFAVSNMHRWYYNTGHLENDVLYVAEGYFSNDKLGLVTSLVKDNSVNYADFKAVLPTYISYYQGEEYKSKKNIEFIAHYYENNFMAFNGKYARLVYDYASYSYLRDHNFINGDPIPYYSEEFFDNQALIFITFDRLDNKEYYDLLFDEIYLQDGYLTVKAEMVVDETKTLNVGRFSLAEISKEKLTTLENDHVGYIISSTTK